VKRKKGTQSVFIESNLHFVRNVEVQVYAVMVYKKTSAESHPVVGKESATMGEYDGNVLNVVAQACVHTAGEKPVAKTVVAVQSAFTIG
jgi:hypothetical protein